MHICLLEKKKTQCLIIKIIAKIIEIYYMLCMLLNHFDVFFCINSHENLQR